MPTARGRQASKKKAAPKRRRKKMSAVLPPREEVILVVPLADPGLLIEAPVAPHVEHPLRPRGTARGDSGAPLNHNNWHEQDRNNVLHHLCGQLDRTVERMDQRFVDMDSKVGKTVIAILAGILVLMVLVGVVLVTHKETSNKAETRLLAAEKKIKVLLATSAEKDPSTVPFGQQGAIIFGSTTNGNTTGSNNVFFGTDAEKLK